MSEEETASQASPEDVSMRRILEALFFASPEPVTTADLVQAFGNERKAEIHSALESLVAEYDSDQRGLAIEKIAGGFRITTDPSLADVLREFVRRKNKSRLSKAALETLAMVAYKQPVTAPEIEAVRGVNPSSILKSLLERKLVKIVGRKKVVGKPFLYGTTPVFLEHFGLNSEDDLPSLDEFSSLLDGAIASVAAEPEPSNVSTDGSDDSSDDVPINPAALEPTPPATGDREDKT
jgi:segregation and condensation protein B